MFLLIIILVIHELRTIEFLLKERFKRKEEKKKKKDSDYKLSQTFSNIG